MLIQLTIIILGGGKLSFGQLLYLWEDFRVEVDLVAKESSKLDAIIHFWGHHRSFLRKKRLLKFFIAWEI